MKPICIPCKRFFRQKKTGFYFIEAMPTEAGAKPGIVEHDKWKPYKLWAGDRWECEGCGASIVVGCANRPISEHYEPDFEKQVEQFSPTLQVNDC